MLTQLPKGADAMAARRAAKAPDNATVAMQHMLLAEATGRFAAQQEQIAAEKVQLATERQAFAAEQQAARAETTRQQAAAVEAASRLSQVAQINTDAVARAAAAESAVASLSARVQELAGELAQECAECDRLEAELTAALTARAEVEGRLAAMLANPPAAAPVPSIKGYKMAVTKRDENGFAREYALTPQE